MSSKNHSRTTQFGITIGENADRTEWYIVGLVTGKTYRGEIRDGVILGMKDAVTDIGVALAYNSPYGLLPEGPKDATAESLLVAQAMLLATFDILDRT